MSENLTYCIFKELAVIEGLRTPAGEWEEVDMATFRRLLRQAGRVVYDMETTVPAKDSDDETGGV